MILVVDDHPDARNVVVQLLSIDGYQAVAKLTPMLIISPATGPYGGNLTLRGVASPTSNASSEPAVTINIDGVPLSYGGVVRMGNIDIGQVEVLKGPQALFFGKNSTGGIVSMRSAEPTSTFQSQLSAGYEFNAHQVDLDGYVSGPVTDTLDMRLAGRFSRQRGFFRNVAPARSIDYAPGTDEEGVRLSANWMPTDRLTVKLRATYDHVRENGSYTTSQKIACPLGAAQGPGAIAGTDDCKPNDTVVFAAIPSAAIQAVTGNPAWNSDSNFLKVRQYLISSDISYKLTDDITLNSVTGWYGIRQRVIDAQTSGARFFIGGLSSVRKNAFSQEVRLSYASPDSPRCGRTSDMRCAPRGGASRRARRSSARSRSRRSFPTRGTCSGSSRRSATRMRRRSRISAARCRCVPTLRRRS